MLIVGSVMQKLPPFLPVPEVPESERSTLVQALLELIEALQQRDTALQEQNHALQEQVEALKQEVARLKGHSGKPNIQPSRLGREDKKKKKKREKNNRNKGGGGPPEQRQVDETVVVKAENVPPGSQFKGYADFTVQELVIKPRITRYRLEKWLQADGHLLTAQLPPQIQHGHFGPMLVSFVLYQYYHGNVTEPLIVQQLREWGVSISSGQVHRLITEGKERFHREKDQILRVGLQLSPYVHVDDTGARHQGKNGYCTHIGNELFAWFQSTDSKSRMNFLSLLRAGNRDCVLNEQAIEYMRQQKLPLCQIEFLSAHLGRFFPDEQQWRQALDDWGISDERHIRIATAGVLLGSALEHGLNPELIVLSDDAGQFNILLHALCWVHAERTIAKLVGFNDDQRAALENARNQIWDLYQILKAYKEAPGENKKTEIRGRFNLIFRQQTCFATLNLALERLYKNNKELLLVLDHPELPLHNNLSEGDIREYVKRRKLSGGTRSDEGRRCRDTFASLKKTCRKQGISFWHYLQDRVMGMGAIPPLPELIAARAQAP